MGDNTCRFLKVYLVFLLAALLINLSLEMLIPTPEEKEPLGIAIFYAIFSLPGSFIFVSRFYKPAIMGLFSFILGFIFEFTFMRPDWVLRIYALEIGGGVIVAFIVSAIYWFIAWGAPSYFIRKYLEKLEKPPV